jgi:hypothetical protein
MSNNIGTTIPLIQNIKSKIENILIPLIQKIKSKIENILIP